MLSSEAEGSLGGGEGRGRRGGTEGREKKYGGAERREATSRAAREDEREDDRGAGGKRGEIRLVVRGDQRHHLTHSHISKRSQMIFTERRDALQRELISKGEMKLASIFLSRLVPSLGRGGMKALARRESTSLRRMIRLFFEQHDLDGDGLLDPEELSLLLHQYGNGGRGYRRRTGGGSSHRWECESEGGGTRCRAGARAGLKRGSMKREGKDREGGTSTFSSVRSLLPDGERRPVQLRSTSSARIPRRCSSMLREGKLSSGSLPSCGELGRENEDDDLPLPLPPQSHERKVSQVSQRSNKSRISLDGFAQRLTNNMRRETFYNEINLPKDDSIIVHDDDDEDDDDGRGEGDDDLRRPFLSKSEKRGEKEEGGEREKENEEQEDKESRVAGGFDGRRGRGECENEIERDESEDGEEEQKRLLRENEAARYHAVVRRAGVMMIGGCLIVLVFSDVMVNAMAEIGRRINLSPFYVSFILSPIGTCC